MVTSTLFWCYIVPSQVPVSNGLQVPENSTIWYLFRVPDTRVPCAYFCVPTSTPFLNVFCVFLYHWGYLRYLRLCETITSSTLEICEIMLLKNISSLYNRDRRELISSKLWKLSINDKKGTWRRGTWLNFWTSTRKMELSSTFGYWSQ